MNDPLDPDPPFEGQDAPAGERADETLRGRATDFMRKALVAGVGALFLTEEGIRNLVGELKLPKELIGALLAQAERTKEEIVRILGEEVRRFLESSQLHEELFKLLTDVTIEIKTEVKLHPQGKELNPELVSGPKVGLRRARRKGK